MNDVYAVIGKNYGDEGKGLTVDHLCTGDEKPLVIRHNGGAQSGHTVETDGKRFVFHQLSSGSFHGADTFWAGTYLPDLYKLQEEIEAFAAVGGVKPAIFCDPETQVTLVDDVLVNMALESARGSGRHGSCGMGINEADLRGKAGFGVRAADFLSGTATEMTKRLLEIRREYLPKRLQEAGLTGLTGEYAELLSMDTVIENAVEQMMQNAELVRIPENRRNFFRSYSRIIFENGQGLLLDACNEAEYPHVTASRTGLTNPIEMMEAYNLSPLQEVIYVSRPYVTRHGAGPLAHECSFSDLGIRETDLDRTNVPNPWQGSLRCGYHPDFEGFIGPVEKDLEPCGNGHPQRVSLMLTQLDLTGDRILMEQGPVETGEFCDHAGIRKVFDCVYGSFHREGKVRRLR